MIYELLAFLSSEAEDMSGVTSVDELSARMMPLKRHKMPTSGPFKVSSHLVKPSKLPLQLPCFNLGVFAKTGGNNSVHCIKPSKCPYIYYVFTGSNRSSVQRQAGQGSSEAARSCVWLGLLGLVRRAPLQPHQPSSRQENHFDKRVSHCQRCCLK